MLYTIFNPQDSLYLKSDGTWTTDGGQAMTFKTFNEACNRAQNFSWYCVPKPLSEATKEAKKQSKPKTTKKTKPAPQPDTVAVEKVWKDLKMISYEGLKAFHIKDLRHAAYILDPGKDAIRKFGKLTRKETFIKYLQDYRNTHPEYRTVNAM